MDNTFLFVIIGCSAVAGILILAFLIGFLSYQQRLRNLYRDETRDERFAGALLKQIFGEQVILNPYVLRDDSKMPAQADAILVCSGGVAVISVLKGGGMYSASEQGQWRVIDNGEMRQIDNLLERQQSYIAEISATLMKHSLRTPPIHGYVFLTDDSAATDYMSSDRVMTGSRLIAELKYFGAQKRLRGKEQRSILEAIQKNHDNISQTFLYRSQRGEAVPDPVEEREEQPDEEQMNEEEFEFDLTGLIRSAEAGSDDAPSADGFKTTKIHVVTESEYYEEDDEEEN